MSTEMANLYEWQTPLLIAAVPVLVLSGFFYFSDRRTWWVLAFALLLLWLMYAGIVYLRTRAGARIDDDAVLHVRRYLGWHEVREGEVAEVRELFNGRSPDVILITKAKKKIVVPSSKLNGGHSVLFRWLSEAAPDARYDKGAERIRAKLAAGGHIDWDRPLI